MEIRSRQEKTHTPGPWELEFDESGFYVGNPGQMVARIYPVVPMRWVGDKLTHEAANAHLIAAAPDMAQALGELIAEFEREADENLEKAMGPMICAYSYEDTVGISFARAALKKAGV